MIFTWGSHKIAIAPLKQTGNANKQRSKNFLTLMNSEQDIVDSTRHSDYICPMVVKGLMVTINEGETILVEA